MKYESGDSYKGSFSNNKFNGKGFYSYADGDEYEGDFQDGKTNGIGVWRHNDGRVEYARWEKGNQVGDGLEWSADLARAHRAVAGKMTDEVSLSMATKLARDMFDLPPPAPSTSRRFKDLGDEGTYDGKLVNGSRQGNGKMVSDCSSAASCFMCHEGAA